MPFKNGFGENWGLAGKVAMVFGNNGLARAVSDALAEEGVRVVDEYMPQTSILVTVPFEIAPKKRQPGHFPGVLVGKNDRFI